MVLNDLVNHSSQRPGSQSGVLVYAVRYPEIQLIKLF